jgi:hypothetical protein
MAMVSLGAGQGFFYPMPWSGANVPGFGTALAMDATAEKVAFIVPATKSGTLDKFEFRLTTVTQAPANGLKCSFQAVDATTGVPSGTPLAYRVVTSGLTANTWIVPGLLTDDGTDGGVKHTVTRGDLVACVIEFQSFTAGDNLTVTTSDDGGTTAQPFAGRAYHAHFTASWAKATAGAPVVALKYNDATYGPIPQGLPISSVLASAIGTGSTPDELGTVFQLVAPMRVGGAWVRVDLDGDADVVLYDSDGTTVLESASIDKDIRPSTAAFGYFVPFDTDVDLLDATTYRMVVKPTTATTLTVYGVTVNSAAIVGAIGGAGTAFHRTARTDAGSWIETTTIRPFVGLWVTGIEDGGSGGEPSFVFVG